MERGESERERKKKGALVSYTGNAKLDKEGGGGKGGKKFPPIDTHSSVHCQRKLMHNA